MPFTLSKNSRSLIVGIVFLVCIAEPVIAANPFLPDQTTDRGWPFVRGPDYNGHSKELKLADSWPEKGPPVLWTCELGQGYSSLIALGERVYTQFQDIGGQYVVCLDATSGNEIWKYRYAWPYEMVGMYPGPRATPTLANGFIYFAAPSGLLGCLDSNGRLVWSVPLTERYDGQGTGFGYACSPTVVDGTVFMPVGGKQASMVALDARDGSILWTTGSDSASYSPAFPITIHGRQEIIGYLEHAIVGHDANTGKINWRVKLSHGYDEHSAWPIYQEPFIWISSPFRGGSRLLELPESVGGTCKTIWQETIMSNDVASSVLVDGFIYGFDVQEAQSKAHRPTRGSFRCIELATGKQRWANGNAKRRRKGADGTSVGHASVIVADGKLILFNDTGELIMARASPDGYQELARTSVLNGDINWSTPALHNGRLYVRNHTRAVCLYVGHPDLLDQQTASNATTVAQIPKSIRLDLAGFLGVEPEYSFDAPSLRWLRNWYIVSIALLVAGLLVALPARFLFRSKGLTWKGTRTILLSTVFLLGVLGTTFLSIWQDEFIFTWPLALFVSFQAAVDQLRIGKPPLDEQRPSWWRPRIPAALFIAVSVLYFLICRRLSLAAEWAFLTGFAAALPVQILGIWLTRMSKNNTLVYFLLLVVSFTAFFAAAVAVLALKYDLTAT